MEENYNLESDSDEEEEEETAAPVTKTANWHLEDIEKLKEQTNELLNSQWKEVRNRHLLSKMLELEQPTVTVKMVDFLLQGGVCESLVGFVTLISPSAHRPAPHDPPTDSLKLSYRAVVLLSNENPSDALSSFLGKKASLIARLIFDAFRKDSAASFYHVYKIVECLLRFYPAEVYEGICSDGKVFERMVNMMQYIGYAPVCELLVMLIALTPVPRTSQLFMVCSKSRWSFFEELSQWNLMLKISKAIVNADDVCVTDSYISAEQHSTAAALLMQELVEKLSLEDTGELLLQPFGYTTSLLDALIDCSIGFEGESSGVSGANGNGARDNNSDGKRKEGGGESGSNSKSSVDNHPLRRGCTRLICYLLRRAAESEIMCFINYGNGAPPAATYVPNRLYPLRERIVNHIRTRLADINQSILSFDASNNNSSSSSTSSSSSSRSEGITFSSYTVEQPFTALRSLIIEMLVLMAESDETVAGAMSVELWTKLIQWTLTFAHNNIYHALFYRLIFAVLRQGQEESQRLVFKEAKFANFLVDSFSPLLPGGLPPRPSAITALPEEREAFDLLVRRTACRGLVMNCSNAVRLQVSVQPPNSFLPTYLSQNPAWVAFLPTLSSATDQQLKFGMGIFVSNTDSRPSSNVNPSLSMLISEPAPDGDRIEDAIEHGSRFAKSLGFYEEENWSSLSGGPGHLHHPPGGSPGSGMNSPGGLLNNDGEEDLIPALEPPAPVPAPGSVPMAVQIPSAQQHSVQTDVRAGDEQVQQLQSGASIKTTTAAAGAVATAGASVAEAIAAELEDDNAGDEGEREDEREAAAAAPAAPVADALPPLHAAKDVLSPPRPPATLAPVAAPAADNDGKIGSSSESASDR